MVVDRQEEEEATATATGEKGGLSVLGGCNSRSLCAFSQGDFIGAGFNRIGFQFEREPGFGFEQKFNIPCKGVSPWHDSKMIFS